MKGMFESFPIALRGRLVPGGVVDVPVSGRLIFLFRFTPHPESADSGRPRNGRIYSVLPLMDFCVERFSHG